MGHPAVSYFYGNWWATTMTLTSSGSPHIIIAPHRTFIERARTLAVSGLLKYENCN